MSRLVDRIKTQLHRDLVADPVAHAWVLNLYRVGEHHHQTVIDYFPIEHAPSRDLADAMLRHRRDEERHDRMYTTAIRRLGQPIVAAQPGNVFNHVIRRYTPVSFKIEPTHDAETRRLKVANFLAHAHFLEKRIARSLEFHLAACEHGRSHGPAKVVAAVQSDEGRHVGYTHDAVFDLTTRAEAERILAVHRRAEAKANLAFSRAQMQQCARMFPNIGTRAHRLLYGFCAFVMDEAIEHV